MQGRDLEALYVMAQLDNSSEDVEDVLPGFNLMKTDMNAAAAQKTTSSWRIFILFLYVRQNPRVPAYNNRLFLARFSSNLLAVILLSTIRPFVLIRICIPNRKLTYQENSKSPPRLLILSAKLMLLLKKLP